MSYDPYQPQGVAAYSPAPPMGVAPYKEPVMHGPWAMNYTGGFDMIHRIPEWFTNLLTAGIMIFIPVIGGLVLTGYSMEATEILHRTSGAYCPRFDFNRFVDYLVRGVGPFLVQLMFGLLNFVAIMFVYMVMIVTAIGAGAAAEGGNEAAAGIGVMIGVLLVIAAIFAFGVLIFFFQLPMAMRAGVSSDIGQGFNFAWAIDFIKKTWVEMLLVLLFQILISIPFVLFVMVTCYLGIIPGISYMFLLMAWLQFQLYRVYLSRGGQPIPLMKPAPIVMYPG